MISCLRIFIGVVLFVGGVLITWFSQPFMTARPLFLLPAVILLGGGIVLLMWPLGCPLTKEPPERPKQS
jgi:hypothetical protein